MIKTYQKILDLLTPREKRLFLALMCMTVIMGCLEVLGIISIVPFLALASNPDVIHTNDRMSAVYDYMGFESDREFLKAAGLFVFCMFFLSIAFKTFVTYALIRFSTMRNFSIASRLLRGYLRQPYAWFLNRHSADLGRSILSEVDQVVTRSVMPAMKLLMQSITTAAIVCMLMLVDPLVTIAAAAALGGSYALVFLIMRQRLLDIGSLRVKANLERYQMAQEALGGIKEVKVLGLEEGYLNRFSAPARRFASTQAASKIISQIPRHILQAVAFGGLLILMLAMLAEEDQTLNESIPLLGLFALAGNRLFPALQDIYISVTTMRFGAPALDALHKEFADLSGREPKQRNETPMGLHSEIEFDGVRFAYPGASSPALRNMDLKIAANTSVGLVGGTGAGKTTAVDVIMGLLEPQEGSIRVDGVEITRQNRSAWLRTIGYVPQHIFLTDDTVAANIAFGIDAEEIDMEAVERAARIAELHDFVTGEMPKGYDTMVGERGVRLSGGQRQRIGIARALYHNPDVLVMDEATSALDNLTERAVMDAVHNLAGAKTVIMIAHRLSTVQRCDRIVLMENGRIAVQGSYQELMESSPSFRAMAAAHA